MPDTGVQTASGGKSVPGLQRACLLPGTGRRRQVWDKGGSAALLLCMLQTPQYVTAVFENGGLAKGEFRP